MSNEGVYLPIKYRNNQYLNLMNRWEILRIRVCLRNYWFHYDKKNLMKNEIDIGYYWLLSH